MLGAAFELAPGVVDPFPSWPVSFLPQHSTVNRSFEMAQLCDPLPVAIPLAATSLARSVPTRVGVAVPFAIGLPSWPELFEPQQYTALVLVTPQTCAKPVEI